MRINQRTYQRYRQASAGAFFLVFALLLGIASGLMLFNMQKSRDYVETEATIVDFDWRYSGSDDTMTADVYVNYTFNGVEYEHRYYPEYSSSWDLFDKITVLVNPEDPGELAVKFGVLPYVLAGLAAVFAVLALVIFIAGKSQAKADGTDGRIVIGNDRTVFGSDDVSGADGSEDGEPDYVPDETGSEETFIFRSGLRDRNAVLEDEFGTRVCEAKFLKNRILRASDAEFFNYRSGRRAVHKIGVTVTVNEGMSSERTYFSFDGQNVFDYLESRGIVIQADLSNDFFYTVRRHGESVARVTPVDAEEPADQKPKFGSVPVTFRVETHDEDLDGIFLAVFALTRAGRVFF